MPLVDQSPLMLFVAQSNAGHASLRLAVKVRLITMILPIEHGRAGIQLPVVQVLPCSEAEAEVLRGTPV
jgi:hypothetical protein